MKRKAIIYTSPEMYMVTMKVRSVVAASVTGSTEGVDVETGIYSDGYGNEGYNYDEGKW